MSVKRKMVNAPGGRWIAESRMLMETHLGRLLDRKEHVHHIDCNPANNALGNLQVMAAGDHIRLHAALRWPYVEPPPDPKVYHIGDPNNPLDVWKHCAAYAVAYPSLFDDYSRFPEVSPWIPEALEAARLGRIADDIGEDARGGTE
jgi:hypothetical protein